MTQLGCRRGRTHDSHDAGDSITLAVENKNFVCSRSKLISHSEFFNVMLSRYYKEDDGGVITLKGIHGKTMEEILLLVHSSSHSVRRSKLPEVIILCDMLLFEKLKTKLICEACQYLSLFNCIKIWMKLEILSVVPLVWKAKSLSLTTFAHQRNRGVTNNLKLPELLTYLGHPNLQCGSEMNVFHSIIQWNIVNRGGVSEYSLKETLGCINYEDVTLSELSDMKKYYLVSKYENIVNILDYIIKMKCGEEVETNNEYCEIARAWFSSRGRYLPKYLFVYNDDFGHEFFYHGHREERFVRKVATIFSKSIDGLTGCEVQAYKMKVYIFGGEFSMGKGIWNENFWEFDLDTELLDNTEYGIPKRRHFKSCIVGDNLYIIGGTGPFRVRKNDMHWFNFTTKKWREEAIPLPCCQTSIKYCNFNGQLFILDCPSRHGYIFIHDVPWKSVKISDSVQMLMEECSSFSMFAYRGNLFFKGRRLLELKLVDDKLDLKEVHDIPHYCDKILIDTSISHNRVYSLYADQIHGDIRLQYLNLDNLKSIYIENVGLHYDSYIRNKNCKIGETAEIIDSNFPRYLKYNPNKMTKMFMFHDHKFCAFEDLLVGNV